MPGASDLSQNKNQPSEPFSIKTSTFDIPKQEIKVFSQAKSIAIIWKQTTIEISKEGLDVLHNFTANQNVYR
jgi:hypothetical protein